MKGGRDWEKEQARQRGFLVSADCIVGVGVRDEKDFLEVERDFLQPFLQVCECVMSGGFLMQSAF